MTHAHRDVRNRNSSPPHLSSRPGSSPCDDENIVSPIIKPVRISRRSVDAGAPATVSRAAAALLCLAWGQCPVLPDRPHSPFISPPSPTSQNAPYQLTLLQAHHLYGASDNGEGGLRSQSVSIAYRVAGQLDAGRLRRALACVDGHFGLTRQRVLPGLPISFAFDETAPVAAFEEQVGPCDEPVTSVIVLVCHLTAVLLLLFYHTQ
jgi:hypothetical protein